MSQSGEMTTREAGRLGGLKRKADGADFGELGRKGGSVTRARHGSAFYARIGKIGGNVMRGRGPAYFQGIGKKGGQRVRELCERGKSMEREG